MIAVDELRLGRNVPRDSGVVLQVRVVAEGRAGIVHVVGPNLGAGRRPVHQGHTRQGMVADDVVHQPHQMGVVVQSDAVVAAVEGVVRQSHLAAGVIAEHICERAAGYQHVFHRQLPACEHGQPDVVRRLHQAVLHRQLAAVGKEGGAECLGHGEGNAAEPDFGVVGRRLSTGVDGNAAVAEFDVVQRRFLRPAAVDDDRVAVARSRRAPPAIRVGVAAHGVIFGDGQHDRPRGRAVGFQPAVDRHPRPFENRPRLQRERGPRRDGDGPGLPDHAGLGAEIGGQRPGGDVSRIAAGTRGRIDLQSGDAPPVHHALQVHRPIVHPADRRPGKVQCPRIVFDVDAAVAAEPNRQVFHHRPRPALQVQAPGRRMVDGDVGQRRRRTPDCRRPAGPQLQGGAALVPP